MFRDRADAGRRLARVLEKYRGTGALVLAIPRGGVEVGYEVAKRLNAGFSIVVSRKLPYPYNPEAGFGAVAEDGSTFIFDFARRIFSEKAIAGIINEQKAEAKRRVDVLRKGKPLPDIKGRVVIIVDDGIAMGATMRAAIMLCRKAGAKKIIAAAPVAGMDPAGGIKKSADELAVVEMPDDFHSVAGYYENWYDVTDDEVKEILGRK